MDKDLIRWEDNRQLGLMAQASQDYLNRLIKDLRQEQYDKLETTQDLIQAQAYLRALSQIEAKVKVQITDGHKAEKYLQEESNK